LWRLVFEKLATLEELETIWNLDDVDRANALLDMRQAMEQKQIREAKHKR